MLNIFNKIINSVSSDLTSSDKDIIQKTKKTKVISTRTNNISDRLELIHNDAIKFLKHFYDKVDIILTKEKLKEVVDEAIEKGIVALDTETTGTNTNEDTIIGFSIATSSKFGYYVPIEHISYMTRMRLQSQMQREDAIEQLKRLSDSDVKIINHNADFDVRMFNNDFGILFKVYWDTMIAARMLNNTEKAGLKFQYNKKIRNDNTDFNYNTIFKDIDFRIVPFKTSKLYAGADGIETFGLYEYQVEEFKKYPNIYDNFINQEMPLFNEQVIEMELEGIGIDFEKAKELENRYLKEQEILKQSIYKQLDEYGDKIQEYNIKNGNKLSNPINLSSPTQIAIIIYDILGQEPVNKKAPRSVDSDALELIKLPFVRELKKLRGVEKILSTYVIKLPKSVNKKTNRIHCVFDQVGTDTGRFSSKDPNLQNIPAKGDKKEVRNIFAARPDNVFISSDYSQQEPRLLAHYSGDETLINAYMEGKDVYAMIGSIVYKVDYEDCLEFYPLGRKIILDGKEFVVDKPKTYENEKGHMRRTIMKGIVLGIMYGRQSKSVADSLEITLEEAQDVIDRFFKAFPKVKLWIDGVVERAKKVGYVETLGGRRRYINDITLPEFELKSDNLRPKDFNPLDFDNELEEYELSDTEKENIIKKYKKSYGWQAKLEYKEELKRNGITIIDNSRKVGDAERQIANTHIQGSAGDMTKRAMLAIARSEELKELDFKLLLTVHDEVIGECPIVNAKRAGELVVKIMIEAASTLCSVPMKCDANYFRCWDGESLKKQIEG